MIKNKVRKKDEPSVEEQIQELRRDISAITTEISDLKTIVADLRGEAMPKLLMPMEKANPWTLQTASKLSYALAGEIASLGSALSGNLNDQYALKLLETYRPTLNALKSVAEGCTAEEVGKITRRSRNLESGYLYRLYLAGLLERRKIGRKIKYVLENKPAS